MECMIIGFGVWGLGLDCFSYFFDYLSIVHTKFLYLVSIRSTIKLTETRNANVS